MFDVFAVSTDVRAVSETAVFVAVYCCATRRGLSKGVGFVRFDQRHEAERSIKQLNGLIPDGSGEPITVKFANSPSSSRHNGNNSMNNNHFPLSSASMAAYLSPTRRLMGSLHHPANRFRCVRLICANVTHICLLVFTGVDGKQV